MSRKKPLSTEALLSKILGFKAHAENEPQFELLTEPIRKLMEHGYKVIPNSGGIGTAGKGGDLFHASVMLDMKAPTGERIDVHIQWSHPKRRRMEGGDYLEY